MEALAASRAGDVVRVEPGIYREPVVIRDGVDLVARVPGTVTIAHPSGTAAAVLTIAGTFNVRVAGIHLDADSAADVGVRVAAPAATLDLVEITGQIRRAIDLSPASSLTVRGSRIAITGSLLTLPDEGHATLVNSVFVRSHVAAEPALYASASPNLVLRGNVFAGFGAVIEGITAARRAELLAGNIVIPIEAAPAGAATGAARPRGGR